MGVTVPLSPGEIAHLAHKANMVRRATVDLAETAKNGHYGSAFSIAEILAVLYYGFLRYRVQEPLWADRDRFILSKGHAALALYPVLADVGFFPVSVLDEYTLADGRMGDHPKFGSVPGVDCTTGSLGHGLSAAVGMALGLRLKSSPGRVVCLLGDGELNEGQIWEAAMSASHFELGNLLAIVDVNAVGSGGTTAHTMELEPLVDKWDSFGWNVLTVPDGHDIEALHAGLSSVSRKATAKPTVVIARTVAGKGVGFMEGTWQWHLGYLGPQDRARALAELDGSSH